MEILDGDTLLVSPSAFFEGQLMALHLILAAALLLATAAPVLAQEKNGKPDSQVMPQEMAHEKLDIQIPDNILRGEAAYAAVFQKLTDDQKTHLVTLDQAFYVTMVPILETYDIGGKLIFCLGEVQAGSAISSNNPQYVQSFRAYQAEKIAEQKNLWQEHRGAAVKVEFIDHALMDAHYGYIESVQKSAVEQMVNAMGRSGGYRGTDCREIQKTLDASANRAQKTGNQPLSASPLPVRPSIPANPPIPSK